MSINITNLVALLEKAKDAYYNTGNPIMSDREFDVLEGNLRSVDPFNKYFTKVGSSVRGDKVSLPVPMGSLDQLHEDSDIQRWLSKLSPDEQLIISDKLDGVSAMVVFDESGALQIAYSRGDGIKGHDITRHIKRIKQFPSQVKFPSCLKGSFAVRCEVILPKEKFPYIQGEMNSRGEPCKTARNYVSGQLNRKESDDLFYDNVHVIAYQVMNSGLKTKDEMRLLQKHGIPCVFMLGFTTEGMDFDYLKTFLDNRKKKSEYELDGLVLCVNEPRTKQKLFSERQTDSLNPAYARKFKAGSEDNKAVTRVAKVHWNPSKWGYLNPQVEIDPVELQGVTITFATGFNAKFISDNKINEGTEIEITRSGDVIPYITKILTPSESPSLPDAFEWEWNETGVDAVLKDVDGNREVQFQRVLDFFVQLEVPQLKESNMRELFNTGLDTVGKVVNADYNVFTSVIGRENGDKIYHGINDKLSAIYPAALAGASLCFGRGVGERKIRPVFEMYPNFKDWNVEDLVKVKGIAVKSAESIMAGVLKYEEFLKSIEGKYSFNSVEPPKASNSDYKDFVVVFTEVRDSEMEKKIVDGGGKIGSSVSKKTTHLIRKEDSTNTTKSKKAIDLGISNIWNYQQALEFFGMKNEGNTLHDSKPVVKKKDTQSKESFLVDVEKLFE